MFPQLVLHLRLVYAVYKIPGIRFALWVSLESHEFAGDALRLASGLTTKHVSLYDKNTQFDPLSLRIDIHLSWTGIHMSWFVPISPRYHRVDLQVARFL